MGSCPQLQEVVVFHESTSLRATLIDAPFKETKSWL